MVCLQSNGFPLLYNKIYQYGLLNILHDIFSAYTRVSCSHILHQVRDIEGFVLRIDDLEHVKLAQISTRLEAAELCHRTRQQVMRLASAE